MLLYFASLFHHCFSGMFTRSLSETTTQDFLKENESKIQPRCVQLNVEASLNLFLLAIYHTALNPLPASKTNIFICERSRMCSYSLFHSFLHRTLDADLTGHNNCRMVGLGMDPWCYKNTDCDVQTCDACQRG